MQNKEREIGVDSKNRSVDMIILNGNKIIFTSETWKDDQKKR